MSKSDSPVGDLVNLGMSRYQAMIYSSLFQLGISGVSDIARSSGVPRTKAYEVLDELAKMGAVEFRAGRPTLYKAIPPQVLVRELKGRYTESAARVAKLMRDERPREARRSQSDLVWTVKGWDAIRRKVSELISFAERNVMMIEACPPELMKSVRATLKSCQNRGVRVRAFALAPPGVEVDRELDFVDYRRLRLSDEASDPRMQQMLEFVRGMQSGSYAVTIVDDSHSFMALPRGRYDEESLGISLKVPGLPALQKVLVEGLISSQTGPL